MNERQVMPRVLVVALLVLFGRCASTEPVQVDYDTEQDLTTYTSNRVLMGSLGMAQGLASGQRIMWQARASCAGRGCTPREVELILYNEGDHQLNVDTRRLQLNYDGASQDWEDLSRVAEPAYFNAARGEFFRTAMDGGEFARMAAAAQVEALFGQSGTQAITISYERRSAFRAFAVEVGLDDGMGT
jgi:hypothetical protein